MIERYVFIKLKGAHATSTGRAEVVKETTAKLPNLPGVLGVTVGTPADDPSGSEWDVSIVARFAKLEDIEAYRIHPEHRAYVDDFLRPRMQAIKAWNFDVVTNTPMFERYIGIDYSGARDRDWRIPGIEVSMADGASNPERMRPEPEEPTWKWCRTDLASWLRETLVESPLTIVGIDHAFSFPISYLRRHGLNSWPSFLDHARHKWPTHKKHVTVDELLEKGTLGGSEDELRLCEQWTSSAKSVFATKGQGRVAYSTLAGLPWLGLLRKELPKKLHFWPFDGFAIPPGKSVVSEVCPAMFKHRYPYSGEDRHGHIRDAHAVASWLQDRDREGLLGQYLGPPLTGKEREQAHLEGWILGVA